MIEQFQNIHDVLLKTRLLAIELAETPDFGSMIPEVEEGAYSNRQFTTLSHDYGAISPVMAAFEKLGTLVWQLSGPTARAIAPSIGRIVVDALQAARERNAASAAEIDTDRSDFRSALDGSYLASQRLNSLPNDYEDTHPAQYEIEANLACDACEVADQAIPKSWTEFRLRAALNTGVSGDQRQQLTTTLDAYTHAIDTFIPKQEKANRLADIDAKIAAAKSPAAKAALASERARVELSGEVVTRAQVEAQALAQGNRARTQAANSGASHAATLAREAESMEVSARAALDVADAYLKSSAAGVEAEARRKAATDATRKGISVDEQVRRQLNLQVSEGVATSAKAIAGLRDETAARRAANDNVAAGSYSSALGAVRALKRLGHDDLPSALDALGLLRIPPIAVLPADLIMLPGEGAFGGAIAMAVGNGRVLGYHEDLDGADILQPVEFVGAWRL